MFSVNWVAREDSEQHGPRNLVQDSSLPNHIISKFPNVFRTELHLDEKMKKNGHQKDMDLPLSTPVSARFWRFIPETGR
jgi:hypothetical protein